VTRRDADPIVAVVKDVNYPRAREAMPPNHLTKLNRKLRKQSKLLLLVLGECVRVRRVGASHNVDNLLGHRFRMQGSVFYVVGVIENILVVEILWPLRLELALVGHIFR
jgi:hypothetical protein